MKTKKKNAALIVSLIFLVILALSIVGLAVMNTIRRNNVEITETLFSFGPNYANRHIELSGNNVPATLHTLDANGNLILVDVVPGEYHWRDISGSQTGTITIPESQNSEPTVSLAEQWNQLCATLQKEYSVDVILLGIGVVSLLVLLHAIFFAIRKGKKKTALPLENFCPGCGMPFQTISDRKMRCPACNAEIPVGSHFCSNCGVPFTNSSNYQTANNTSHNTSIPQ